MDFWQIVVTGAACGVAFAFFSIPVAFGIAVIRAAWKAAGK